MQSLSLVCSWRFVRHTREKQGQGAQGPSPGRLARGERHTAAGAYAHKAIAIPVPCPPPAPLLACAGQARASPTFFGDGIFALAVGHNQIVRVRLPAPALGHPTPVKCAPPPEPAVRSPLGRRGGEPQAAGCRSPSTSAPAPFARPQGCRSTRGVVANVKLVKGRAHPGEPRLPAPFCVSSRGRVLHTDGRSPCDKRRETL